MKLKVTRSTEMEIKKMSYLTRLRPFKKEYKSDWVYRCVHCSELIKVPFKPEGGGYYVWGITDEISDGLGLISRMICPECIEEVEEDYLKRKEIAEQKWMSKRSWNYRVVKIPLNEGEVTFNIYKVEYEDGKLDSRLYYENEVLGLSKGSLNELEDTLNALQQAMKLPILELVNGKVLREI